jgi:hypothetical protein
VLPETDWLVAAYVIPLTSDEDFMTEIDEFKSPFLLGKIKQRGIMNDLVTDLLIVERYLRRPELTDSIAVLMLRAAIKNHPLEVEIVSRELRTGRALADPEIEELKASLRHPTPDVCLTS